jgi:hypothetical protein
MWPEKPVTGSWIDCLNAIEQEIESLKRIGSSMPHTNELEEQFSDFRMRRRFDQILRHAGKAVRDLEKA